tara:strand:- start:409 stop:666 length:258 start_codon:yes stop_codon:yes gene_type:complete
MRYAFFAGIFLLLNFEGAAFRAYQRKKEDHTEILTQKALVDQAHREITDSIHYAKLIQAAVPVFSSDTAFKLLLPILLFFTNQKI